MYCVALDLLFILFGKSSIRPPPLASLAGAHGRPRVLGRVLQTRSQLEHSQVIPVSASHAAHHAAYISTHHTTPNSTSLDIFLHKIPHIPLHATPYLYTQLHTPTHAPKFHTRSLLKDQGVLYVKQRLPSHLGSTQHVCYLFLFNLIQSYLVMTFLACLLALLLPLNLSSTYFQLSSNFSSTFLQPFFDLFSISSISLQPLIQIFLFSIFYSLVYHLIFQI